MVGMFRFGIWTPKQYAALGEGRRFSGSRVAYNLLDAGEHPGGEQIRVFEDVSFTLRTSNGTFRTTFRNRFEDIDRVSLECISRFLPHCPIRVQDRAASHALTTAEWAHKLFHALPDVQIEASDLLLELFELSLNTGETFILEPNGTPLQYIRPPLVVGLCHPEARRYPGNRCVSAWGRYRWKHLGLAGCLKTGTTPGCRVRSISCVHPEARALSREHPGFTIRARSVFDRTPGACNVLRTMNILNRHYFSAGQLEEGVHAAFDSLECGGIWIVGRTLEEDFTNHATFFRRQPDGWQLLQRVGNGSEIEDLVLRSPVGV